MLARRESDKAIHFVLSFSIYISQCRAWYDRVVDLALAIALVRGRDVRQWHVPNVRGNSQENLFKNAKGRPLFFSIVQR